MRKEIFKTILIVVIALNFCYVFFVMNFLDGILEDAYNIKSLTFKNGKDYLVMEEMMSAAKKWYVVAIFCLIINAFAGVFFSTMASENPACLFCFHLCSSCWQLSSCCYWHVTTGTAS